MGMLEDIAGHFKQNGIAAQVFIASMPDQPDDAVAVYEYAGRAPEQDMDKRAYTNPGLQILIRSKSYSTARSKIEDAFNLLDRKTNITIGEGRYMKILANQSPFPMGVDENARHRLVVNFDVSRL